MKQSHIIPKGHDSLQYHFYAQDKLFAARIFRTDTVVHHSVWVFDGALESLVTSTAPLIQGTATHLDVTCATLDLKADAATGRLVVRGDGRSVDLSVDFSIGMTTGWHDPAGEAGDSVWHQPNLSCVVEWRGTRLQGHGYCKRYSWPNPPRHWGYRFIHGVTDDRSATVWTADACFGRGKYDYFRVLGPDGALRAPPTSDSWQQDDAAHAILDGARWRVGIERRAEWETEIVSPVMSSLLRQSYCHMTLEDGARVRGGIALNEICYGTLG